MAGVTNREFWDFRVKTRAQFTKLAEQIANIDTSGGGGISELTSKMVVDALGYTPYNAANPANYITASALTPYLKTEDAEETYATKDFVNNKLVDYAPLTSVQGFENRIGGLEGAVPQLNERVTIVEGKVSSLNETVSTGENNLLDRVNTIETDYVTSSNLESAINGIDLSAYLLKADLTKSRIQSTLGISDWALAATKPSYAWSEITSRPTALSQFTDDVVEGKYLHSVRYSDTWDADSIYSAGIFSGRISHLPSGEPYGRILSLPYYNDKSEGTQNFVAHLFITNGDDTITPNEMFFRTAQRNAWNEWNKVITDKNISNYNAGSADILATSFGENINYTTGESSLKLVRYVSDWESNGFPANYSAGLSVMTNYTGWQLLSYGGNIENPYFRSVKDDGVWKAWRQIAFLTDNVASATKLATRHKLWGNDFDGTDDVSGQMYVGGDFFIEHPTTGRQLNIHTNWTILGYNNPFIGNPTYVDGRDVYIRYGNDEYTSVFASSGNVGIGHTSPTEKLDVSGNIKASGNINATSITINGVTITASNGTITVNGNVFATGAITAKLVG